jgi:Arc/MetJ family transcription regulator
MSRDSQFSVNCYLRGHKSLYDRSVITIAKRKTSFEVDTEKVEAAQEILGTKTMTATVDAALDEIVKRRQREGLLELLDTPGAFALDDPEVMKGAWRVGGRSFS